MADTITNESKNRTFVYDALSIFRMNSTAGNTNTLAFIQNWNFNPNMADFDIDRIDSAAPIFTKKSDILGSFDFETVNTTEIYDGSIGTLNEALVTYWINQIALGAPIDATFLVKVRAGDVLAVGNKFVTYSYTGRIMDVSISRIEETGVNTVTVTGEITAITSALRTAS